MFNGLLRSSLVVRLWGLKYGLDTGLYHLAHSLCHLINHGTGLFIKCVSDVLYTLLNLLLCGLKLRCRLRLWCCISLVYKLWRYYTSGYRWELWCKLFCCVDCGLFEIIYNALYLRVVLIHLLSLFDHLLSLLLNSAFVLLKHLPYISKCLSSVFKRGRVHRYTTFIQRGFRSFILFHFREHGVDYLILIA